MILRLVRPAIALVLLAQALFAPTAPAGQWQFDCQAAGSQPEQDECFRAEAHKLEVALDAEYARDLSRLNGQEKALLVKAQTAWKSYRDAHCKAFAGRWAPTRTLKGIQGAQLSACMGALAEARLEELEETYEETSNDEFRFSVEPPEGTSICRTPPPEHVHGVNFLLDGSPDGCDSIMDHPHMGAAGMYNVEPAKSPEEALGDICHVFNATRVSAPPGLAIAGLRSASCQANSADGAWIDIYVVAQYGDLGEQADVNYYVSLRTTPKRLEADLVRFRSFLKTFRSWDSKDSE